MQNSSTLLHIIFYCCVVFHHMTACCLFILLLMHIWVVSIFLMFTWVNMQLMFLYILLVDISFILGICQRVLVTLFAFGYCMGKKNSWKMFWSLFSFWNNWRVAKAIINEHQLSKMSYPLYTHSHFLLTPILKSMCYCFCFANKNVLFC